MNGEAKPDAKNQHAITRGGEMGDWGGVGGHPGLPSPRWRDQKATFVGGFQAVEVWWGRGAVDGWPFQETGTRAERWGVSWSAGSGVSPKKEGRLA